MKEKSYVETLKNDTRFGHDASAKKCAEDIGMMCENIGRLICDLEF